MSCNVPKFSMYRSSLTAHFPKFVDRYNNACINVKPEGGGGIPGIHVGHLNSITFPLLGNLTKNLGPRVGTFAFFARRNGTNSHRPMSLSVCQC